MGRCFAVQLVVRVLNGGIEEEELPSDEKLWDVRRGSGVGEERFLPTDFHGLTRIEEAGLDYALWVMLS
jgi:hypothetical protein